MWWNCVPLRRRSDLWLVLLFITTELRTQRPPSSYSVCLGCVFSHCMLWCRPTMLSSKSPQAWCSITKEMGIKLNIWLVSVELIHINVWFSSAFVLFFFSVSSESICPIDCLSLTPSSCSWCLYKSFVQLCCGVYEIWIRLLICYKWWSHGCACLWFDRWYWAAIGFA